MKDRDLHESGFRYGTGHKDVSKNYIVKAVEGSLSRLQIDYIDLYQTHWDNEATPVEKRGSIWSVSKTGKSEMDWRFQSVAGTADSFSFSKKHHYPVYQTLQPEYNLYDRERFEKYYQPVCAAKNLGVISYYSLASGFLTGKYRSEADLGKSSRRRNKKYLNERGFKILDALDRVAAAHHTTPAGVAIASCFSSLLLLLLWPVPRPEQLRALTDACALQLSEESVRL